jgi:hypothetical protein
VQPELGINPLLFFAEEGHPSVARAKLVCRKCTEVGSCLAKALELGESCSGVWGGTTEAERTSYRRWRRRNSQVGEGA